MQNPFGGKNEFWFVVLKKEWKDSCSAVQIKYGIIICENTCVSLKSFFLINLLFIFVALSTSHSLWLSKMTKVCNEHLKQHCIINVERITQHQIQYMKTSE